MNDINNIKKLIKDFGVDYKKNRIYHIRQNKICFWSDLPKPEQKWLIINKYKNKNLNETFNNIVLNKINHEIRNSHFSRPTLEFFSSNYLSDHNIYYKLIYYKESYTSGCCNSDSCAIDGYYLYFYNPIDLSIY